jgi:hypothetical protein
VTFSLGIVLLFFILRVDVRGKVLLRRRRRRRRLGESNLQDFVVLTLLQRGQTLRLRLSPGCCTLVLDYFFLTLLLFFLYR